MFRDLERVQTSFTGIAAHRDFGANIAYGGASEGGDGVLVSGSYFSVLGLTPHLGRLLEPDDDREAGQRTGRGRSATTTGGADSARDRMSSTRRSSSTARR